MAKERGLTSYLDDWGKTNAPAKEVDNAGGDGGDYEYGNPYRAPLPENPEWGHDGKSGTSYGHSNDVIEKPDYKCWEGVNKDDIAQGYTRLPSDGEGSVLGTRQPGGSFPQSIPDKNIHDRGAGSDAYAREHSDTTGRGFDGRGQPESTSNPGGETIGSSKLPG